MKRILAFSLLCLLLIGVLPLSALAATDMYILVQPQNYVYNEGAVAIYYVTVAGENLTCTWYLEYEGKEYDLTNLKAYDPALSMAENYGPWISHVSGDCGGGQEQNNLDFSVPHTTFSYHFNGCEAGLNGAYIYAVIDNGQYMTKTNKTMIQLSAGAKTPPQVVVPAEAEACKGDKLVLTCTATAVYGGALSYTWYETPDGDLTKITAVNRGEETTATLTCDTNSYGMRYYVCAVEESGGGFTYSSVIPVMILEGQPLDPEESQQPEETTAPTQAATEPTQAVTEETQAITEPATAETEAQQPEESGAEESTGVWLYVGIGLGVVVVGMAAAIVLLLKPKKKQQ